MKTTKIRTEAQNKTKRFQLEIYMKCNYLNKNISKTLHQQSEFTLDKYQIHYIHLSEKNIRYDDTVLTLDVIQK